MKRSFSLRERALLGIAVTLYEKLAKSTQKALEKLNLPDMHVLIAIGNVETIRTRLGTTSNEIEFMEDLRITAKDAIELAHQRAEKVKGDQEELLMPTDVTEEYEYELGALRRAFGEQLDAFNEMTVEARAGDKTTGKVPLGEMKRRMAQMEEQPRA